MVEVIDWKTPVRDKRKNEYLSYQRMEDASINICNFYNAGSYGCRSGSGNCYKPVRRKITSL